jgi:hypothetical protein
VNHGKRDGNQAEIVEAWQKAGAKVIHLDDVRDGCPDKLVGYAGHNWLAEIKTEDGKLTPAQVEFFQTWPGQKAVVHSIEEGLAMIGIRSK